MKSFIAIAIVVILTVAYANTWAIIFTPSDDILNGAYSPILFFNYHEDYPIQQNDVLSSLYTYIIRLYHYY